MNELDMVTTEVFENRRDLLHYSLSLAKLPGAVLEFGVHKGASAEILLEGAGEVWGFDSFKGLPEDWHQGPQVLRKGGFGLRRPPDLPPEIKLVVGWFQDTLVPWIREHPEPLRFIHIDSDLYSSAKYVLTTLNDQIVEGTVIAFDELGSFERGQKYTEWREGEWKALVEWLEGKDRRISFLGRTEAHQVATIVL